MKGPLSADPRLGEAIASSLQLVITLHEGSKARRAAAKRWCYGGIYEFFDEHSEASGEWRWKLERLAARYLLPISVSLNAKTVDPDAGMLEHLDIAHREILAIRDSFDEGYEIAKELDCKPAKRRFGKLLDRCESLCEEMEAYARQVQDQGKGVWLSEHM